MGKSGRIVSAAEYYGVDMERVPLKIMHAVDGKLLNLHAPSDHPVMDAPTLTPTGWRPGKLAPHYKPELCVSGWHATTLPYLNDNAISYRDFRLFILEPARQHSEDARRTKTCYNRARLMCEVFLDEQTLHELADIKSLNHLAAVEGWDGEEWLEEQGLRPNGGSTLTKLPALSRYDCALRQGETVEWYREAWKIIIGRSYSIECHKRRSYTIETDRRRKM